MVASLAFFAFGLGYALFSFVIAVVFRDEVLADMLSTTTSGPVATLWYVAVSVVLVPVWAVWAELRRGKDVRRAIGNVALVVAAILALHLGFTLFKTTMPAIVPYYADPYLAAFDAWLHANSDPWAVINRVVGPETMLGLAPLYHGPWLIAAFLFPVILVACDDDEARIKRYFLLYCASWVVIGNVLALGGMSVGPVFFDRFYDSSRFGLMTLTHRFAGVESTTLGALQEYLWQMSSAGRESFGTGISAFASVHVSVATVVALYCGERSALLAVPAALLCGAILLLSIWSGYHYAADGYVSVGVMALLWAFLRRRFEPAGLLPAFRGQVSGDLYRANR
ncbi:phosphatase PAP2 family protein [Salipiger bermudensis]|uniref:phosphatase PAP2 family protein n=1 Tax=Salipiger bermudensis TaxID=344736 RepID=UPI001CD373B2|nr:phosphatase PAP2 family protein [Salipiger bermudensis]MCA1287102.1 phosphatase PAP2 family protein [Salipiger bermudensis]